MATLIDYIRVLVDLWTHWIVCALYSLVQWNRPYAWLVGRELTGHVARPRCCRVCKISVFDAVLGHFYFPFSPTFENAFFEKKESKPLNFPSFVCRPLFPARIVGVLRSSETSLWKFGSTPCESVTGDTDAAKSSKLFFPSFFFCLLPNISWEAFSERKIALEIFPKKDEGTFQITVQSMTNATFETVGQVRKAIFACLTTD